MHIEKVGSQFLVKACREFLSQDPVANVLPLGDLYSPLMRVSEVYCASEANRVVGVCSIYRAFSTPSVVLGKAPDEVKQALIRRALNRVSDRFISLCPPHEGALFEEYATSLHCHPEHHMIANSPKNMAFRNVKVQRVRRRDLEMLGKFYAAHHAEAWAPIQFESGPFYCVKHEGRIVSAAGVHLVAPQIAQLGNIITDEGYRNRGYATACTSMLATHLAARGRIISLFVRTENAPAIHMYEKLGFAKKRDINFVVMQKKTAF